MLGIFVFDPLGTGFSTVMSYPNFARFSDSRRAIFFANAANTNAAAHLCCLLFETCAVASDFAVEYANAAWTKAFCL